MFNLLAGTYSSEATINFGDITNYIGNFSLNCAAIELIIIDKLRVYGGLAIISSDFLFVRTSLFAMTTLF